MEGSEWELYLYQNDTIHLRGEPPDEGTDHICVTSFSAVSSMFKSCDLSYTLCQTDEKQGLLIFN